ncbi:LOW QUALITY PROTEIN: hypothetical protein YC2023_016563 [Brassica napus]
MAVGFGVWFSGSLRCRGDVLHISFKPGELRRLVVTEGRLRSSKSGRLWPSSSYSINPSHFRFLVVVTFWTFFLVAMAFLVGVIRVSIIGFGVKIRPALATKARVYNLAIRYLCLCSTSLSVVWSFSVGDNYELRQVHRKLATPKMTGLDSASEITRCISPFWGNHQKLRMALDFH